MRQAAEGKTGSKELSLAARGVRQAGWGCDRQEGVETDSKGSEPGRMG